MRTFFGYLPDPKDHRYTGFHRHAAYRASLADFGSIDHVAPPIWNQRSSNSCVGHGTAGAITASHASKGLPLTSPAAPRFLYVLARAVDRRPVAGVLPPLLDHGCEPNSLMRAIAEWGVPLESQVDGGRIASSPDYEDYLEAHINDEPALDELLKSDEMPIVGINAIETEGDNRVSEICKSLASGYAVMAGVSAGNAIFQGYREGILEPSGTSPDHWVYFTAFRTANGRKQVKMRNSWGQGWGIQGTAWCSEDFIRRGLWNILVANLGL